MWEYVEGVKGLQIAMEAFNNAIPGGKYWLMIIVICFGMSSMFSYSFYGNRCASYLFGAKNAKYYTYLFILSLIVFAVVDADKAVGVCDLFYGLMAFPTMFAILRLSPKVKKVTQEYFAKEKQKK